MFGLFGGLFDFNRDGKTDLSEQWLAFKIFEACAKDVEREANYGGLDDSTLFHDGSCSSCLEDDRYEWREYCEDGSEYDLSPEDYETEEEYEAALETARFAWRETYSDTDGSVDPEWYDTEEEYLQAVEEEKYSWREWCEDGSEYDLSPEDYETEEEYEEALEAAGGIWE